MILSIPFSTRGQMWPLSAAQLALRQDGVEFRAEHMTDDEGYFRMMERLWKTGETFAVVEHDVVVWPGAIQQLEDCSELWCTFPYYCSVGWIKDGLGCTKFSAELIRRYPDFLKEPFPTCCAHTRHYCGLDRLIAHRMLELGIEPHVHEPGVCNLNSKWTV